MFSSRSVKAMGIVANVHCELALGRLCLISLNLVITLLDRHLYRPSLRDEESSTDVGIRDPGGGGRSTLELP